MDDDRRSDENQEKPRIKVTDRRKFTADGSPRVPDEEPVDEPSADVEPGVQEAAAAIEEAAAEAQPGAAATAGSDAGSAAAEASQRGEPAATASTAGGPEAAGRAPGGGTTASTPGAPTAAAAAGPKPADAAGAGAGDQPSIADLPRDFSAFVEGMYLEAMLYLGALPDPRTGEPVEDLDMAKYKIDLLGMLQDKTRGNLTDQEGQQLEEVLYQLRMFYVQKTKGDGAEANS